MLSYLASVKLLVSVGSWCCFKKDHEKIPWIMKKPGEQLQYQETCLTVRDSWHSIN